MISIETDPAKMPKQTFRDWNEKMSRKYNPNDYHESANAFVRWIEGTRVRLLLKLLDATEEDRVLEIGVGTGNILETIRSNHRTGLDLSPHYLRIARERLGETVTLVEGDAEKLTEYFEDRSFDRVYCSEVLEHVQYPNLVLSTMASVLTKEGVGVISVPNDTLIEALKRVLCSLGIYKTLFPEIAKSATNEWHLHIFSKRELHTLCSNAGLQITLFTSAPFFLLPLRYVFQVKRRSTPPLPACAA